MLLGLLLPAPAVLAAEGDGPAPFDADPVPEALLPLTARGTGTLYLDARLDGRSENFLLDTGAAMVTINQSLHRRLARSGSARSVREVAARLADGRTRRMTVARIDSLDLGGGCTLRNVEALVLPGEGTNLLGLNALQPFAPLTLRMEPLSLSLSNCAPLTVAAAPAPPR